jgi:hypothetical protein
MVIDLGKKGVTFDPNGYKQEFLDLVMNWHE